MSPRRHLDLPYLPTALIGRDDGLAELLRLLTGTSDRLVTLTGPPGVGKTSLALRVTDLQADRYRAGLALDEPGRAEARAQGASLALEQAVDDALAWLSDDDGGGVQSLDRSDELPEPEPPGDTPDLSVLTRREREVAMLLRRGLTSDRAIAAELVITEGTAGSYVQRVLDRLGLHRRAQAAAWAATHLLDDGA